jgi:hypothetical protein
MVDYLEKFRKEAQAEVAAALAKPLGNEEAIRAAVMQELQAKLVPLARQIAKQCSTDVSVGVGDYIQEIVTDFRESLIENGKTASMPRAGDGVIMFPQGTRLYALSECAKGSYSRGKTNGLLVIEEEPQVRTLLVAGDHDNDYKSRAFHLPMPYVVFLFDFYEYANGDDPGVGLDAFHVAFRTEALRDATGEKWYDPPLPNCGGYTVCMPHQTPDTFDNITLMAEAVIRLFWNSVFGEDSEPIPDEFSVTTNGKKKKIKTFDDWQELRDDPLAILTANWDKTASYRKYDLQDKLDCFANSSANVVATRAWTGLQPLSRPNHIEDDVEKSVLKVLSSFTNSDS